jgi:RNA polymerase sigma factor (sigma-70 family)
LLKKVAHSAASATLLDVFAANGDQLAGYVRNRTIGFPGVEAEDVLQELWVKACTIDASGIEDPKGYLYRIADNIVLQRVRNTNRRVSREADWGFVHGRDHNAVVEPTAERRLLARERLMMIERVLSRLSNRASHIFHRYRIDGMTQRQIADELNVSLSTVEKDLNLAFRALLKCKEKGR